MAKLRHRSSRSLVIDSCQGWTKFTTFGDLDALNEAEWDKVVIRDSDEYDGAGTLTCFSAGL